MNILMIAVNDPAGTASGLADALNRLTAHRCRVATLETRYNHGWRKDLHLPDLDEAGLAELEAALRGADVFHFHMTADEHLRLGPFLPADFLRGKLVVHHHHGHPDFRAHPEKYRARYARRGRRNLLVSTPDLLRLLPEARWQPNAVPEHAPAYRPPARRPPEPPRVAHAPTRKELKNTADLLAVVAELRADGLDLELELIDDAPHAECLRRKARCHMAFDHMQGYYGMSSLESLAQGVPVVAGLDDWCAGHMRAFAGRAELPWIVARDRSELRAALARLARDPEAREAAGRAARRFMEECWSEARVVALLDNFYAGLRPDHAGAGRA
ncbi:hypothetical protein [Desulfocurvus vexinensis]|uniref:hypothetical protein n=1 Tax=Desulfocurvus vexinensis TaxID=399548 RepID=UPI000491787E|nr:hypothetical protein [Desulfocurvus vexinensis]